MMEKNLRTMRSEELTSLTVPRTTMVSFGTPLKIRSRMRLQPGRGERERLHLGTKRSSQQLAAATAASYESILVYYYDVGAVAAAGKCEAELDDDDDDVEASSIKEVLEWVKKSS